MKILISGASGLVGKHLIPELEAKGHEVLRLVRKASASPNEIEWDAEKGIVPEELPRIEGITAVIHLAGDNVAGGYWSDEKKRKIKDSRVIGTRVLVDSLKKLVNPPGIFVSASAIGFYGDRGDEILTESSSAGKGFFPDVCTAWEAEVKKAEEFARTVYLRIGVVVAEDGGALEKMLTPFKLGAGGVVGSGKQWMPWIAIEDVVGVIQFALENNISGALNTTAPNPVTNHDFTKTLGRVLNRPTIVPIPEFAVKLMFGEMGETLLLQGCRVLPKRLEDAGYKFKFTNLEESLKHTLQ